MKVYVTEGDIVNAGTSYLGLQPLLADGTLSAQQTWNVYVGSFNIDVAETPHGAPQSYLAFCVDPWNWSSSTQLAYHQVNLAGMSLPIHPTYDETMLASHANEIAALYSNYYAGTVGNTAKSAAFQLALWEIVSDDDVKKVAATNTTIWNDGQAILSALEASNFAMGGEQYEVTAYYADRGGNGKQIAGQNYLVATEIAEPQGSSTAVPEPGTLALVGLGLAGMCRLRRRNA